MDRYIVTLRGRTEIHNITFGCHPLPAEQDWEVLGEFSSPEEALAAARKTHSSAQPCYWCCPLLNLGPTAERPIQRASPQERSDCSPARQKHARQ